MDMQQKRVYRWEEGPAMAGADPYIIERVAEESTMTFQAFLRGEWEPTGRGGTAREPRYNRKPQMTLREAQALVDRICRDYGVAPIPVVDGDAPFRAAMMRFRKEGGGLVLQHADGRDFIVDLVIPPWTRNVWVAAHEVSHYLTYRFFPPAHENHGPEFVGMLLDVLEEYGPDSWNRRRAEADARRRKIRWAADVFTAAAAV